MVEQQDNQPFMIVVKLHEGYVLNVQGYAIAITNAADLAARVGEVAAQSEGGFQTPPVETDITATVTQVQGPPPAPSPSEVASVFAPPPQQDVASQTDLDMEWTNVKQMMAFLAAGFDPTGKVFTRREWDAALPMFAPHVDPKEAEFALSEFLSELHDDE